MNPVRFADIERSVVGALVLAPEFVDDVLAMVGPDDFADPRPAATLRAVAAVHERREHVDTVTVRNQLVATERLSEAGGDDYLLSMTDVVPTAKLVTEYAQKVAEQSALRRLAAVCERIAAEAKVCDRPAELIESAERRIMAAVDGQKTGKHAVTVKELMVEHLKRIQAADKGHAVGIETGLWPLDESIRGGFKAGQMVVVAGTPGSGKTALAVQLADRARALEKHVLVFSLEMSADEIAGRLIASHSGVNSDSLYQRTAPEGDYRTYYAQLGELAEGGHFHVLDTQRISVPAMRSECRRVKARHGLDMIVVDYLQLMTTGQRGLPRFEEVSEVSRSLKAIAKEFGVPVIALSQLNRKSLQREDKRPIMSDLRESGQIEQDADVILFLYRDEVHNHNTDRPGEAELRIAKQRNGPTTNMVLRFEKERMRFRASDRSSHWGDHG